MDVCLSVCMYIYICICICIVIPQQVRKVRFYEIIVNVPFIDVFWVMWRSKCPKPTIWGWYIPPIYGNAGDSIVLGLPPYIYIYTYTVYIHTYTHIHIHIYIYTHISHTCTCTCTHTIYT